MKQPSSVIFVFLGYALGAGGFCSGYVSQEILLAVGLGAVLSRLYGRRNCGLWLAGNLWGTIAAWLFFLAPWQTYLARLPRQECQVKMGLRICQSAIAVPGLEPESVPRILGQVLWLQTLVDDERVEASGVLPLNGNLEMIGQLVALECGDELEVEGFISMPPAATDVWGYYGSYLRANGWHRRLLVEKMVITGRSGNLASVLQRCISRLRGKIAGLLVKGLEDNPAVGLYVVLGVGLNEYLPRDAKQSFINSGTVHIFAISGLHVGMVVGVGYWLLKSTGMTLRLRWALLAALTLGYTMLTGLSPSSRRAMLMALLALYANWRSRPVDGLHTLALTGLVALLGNPLLVMHGGFLFSYSTVFVLLASAPAMQNLKNLLVERWLWRPLHWGHLGAARRLAFMSSDMVVALAGSSVAWLNSAALAVRTSGNICVLSPLVNLPIALLLPGLLLSIPAKVICGLWFDGCNYLLCKLISLMIFLLQQLSDLAAFSSWSVSMQRLGDLEMACYYGSLWLFLALLVRISAGSTEEKEK